MAMHVYVGKVKSNDSDHDIAKAGGGNHYAYFPDRIFPHQTDEKGLSFLSHFKFNASTIL